MMKVPPAGCLNVIFPCTDISVLVGTNTEIPPAESMEAGEPNLRGNTQ